MKSKIEIITMNEGRPFEFYVVAYKDGLPLRDFKTRKGAERFAKKYAETNNCELVD